MQWFTTQPVSIQDFLNRDVAGFCSSIQEKYEMSSSLAMDKMNQERYSMDDAKNLHPADDYVQAMLRYGRSAGNNDAASLMKAWKDLKWNLQRDVSCPTKDTTPDELVRRIDQAAELWSSQARITSSTSKDSEYQRGFKAGKRHHQEQGYLGYNDQRGGYTGGSNRSGYQPNYPSRQDKALPPSSQYHTYDPLKHAYGPWKAKSAPAPSSAQRLIEAGLTTYHATAEESDEQDDNWEYDDQFTFSDHYVYFNDADQS